MQWFGPVSQCWPGGKYGHFDDSKRVPVQNSPSRDDLARIQGDVVELRNEDRCDRLVQSRTVHVDRGAERKHETAHARVHVVANLQAVHRRWQGCRAESGHSG